MMAAARASRQASSKSFSALRMPSRLKARTNEGMPMANVSPMMATATMISMRVKPRARLAIPKSRWRKVFIRVPSMPDVNAGGDREQCRQDADQNEPNADGHDANNHWLDHVGHHAQGGIQFALVSVGQIAQGAGDVARVLADLDEID